jgi:aldehyde:ferredoxin oxidoreductase
MTSHDIASQTLVLRVDLDAWGTEDRPAAGAVQLDPWSHPDPLRQRIGALAGPALALATLLDAPADDPPFLVSVGPAVQRGVPTAARATVHARSPLTGRLAEGQVGTDLGRRLASVAAALVVSGRIDRPGAALVIEADGSARLVVLAELVGASPEQRRALLAAHLGPCAVLRPGPAADAGVPFANLAAGGDPASFTGRGGVGHAMAARGLAAIVVTAPPIPDRPVPELNAALLGSPRLESRMEGGTLELTAAFAARGDLDGVDVQRAHQLEDSARETAGSRHGCKGCPTPCGWSFEEPGREKSGARFSAVRALGVDLGLDEPRDAFGLLARCNDLGLDAREAAARLAGRGNEGQPAALLNDLDALARAEFGMDAPVAETPRPTRDVAAALGQQAGARGAEPLRSFPFLVGDGVARARIQRLLDPMPVPLNAERATDVAGKGRLVWWHENLVAALDASGFCAFSAAGLLDDGATDLVGLAAWTLPNVGEAIPDARNAGEALLALGATLDGWVRELHEHWGCAERDVPSELEAPSLLGEYRVCRGLDASGRVTPIAHAQLGSRGLLELWRGTDVDQAVAEPVALESVRARAGCDSLPCLVHIGAGGALGRRLGPGFDLEMDLPATLIDVLQAVAQVRPEAASWLMASGVPVPAVWRGGRTLAPEAEIRAGDHLELVLVVSGG